MMPESRQKEVAKADPLNTAARATALEKAAQSLASPGSYTAESLLDLVAAELGHRGVLDGFQDYADGPRAALRSRALAPKCILHIVAGNTPQAALQSLIRGLLLGANNLVKLPSAGLPEIDTFVANLPPQLGANVKLARELDPQWLRAASAIIVFGDDATVHHFRQRARSNQIFIAHGHRISFSVLLGDPDGDAAELAARDVGIYNQQGCLSPHDIYVDEAKGSGVNARTFAADLAVALADYERHDPRGAISTGEAADITALRDSYRYRAANDDRVAIWNSSPGTEWTVIFEADPQFAVSPLNRVVFVKPLPAPGSANLEAELRLVRPHLSSIAIHPFSDTNALSFVELGASRLCPMGHAQDPHPLWHQDGQAQLAPLVQWQDLG
jgi:hypothetical protein